jgi:hypothetical protein
VRRSVQWALLLVFELVAPALRGQISDTTNGKMWLASTAAANDDTTLRSHGFFRQAMGLGRTHVLADSWSFLPSVWCIAAETREWHSIDLEVHTGLLWRRRVHKRWLIVASATPEINVIVLKHSDFKMRFSTGRELRRNNHLLEPFIMWEDVYHLQGHTQETRLHAGVHFQLRQLQVALTYDRARGTEGDGPMNGVSVFLLRSVARLRR